MAIASGGAQGVDNHSKGRNNLGQSKDKANGGATFGILT